jgi:hypothetical protein
MSKPKSNRICVVFSEDACAWMTAEASRRTITVTELIRRVIDEVRGSFIVPHRRGEP